MVDSNINIVKSYQQLAWDSAGQDCGSRLIERYTHVNAAGDTNPALHTVRYHDDASFTNITDHHLCALLKKLSVTFSPGPASYGRVVTITAAFSHSNATAPTAQQVYQLPNSIHFTFGGASDPPLQVRSLECDFSYGIRRMLKPGDVVGGRPILYITAVNRDWGTTQIAGSVLTVHHTATVDLRGNDIVLV